MLNLIHLRRPQESQVFDAPPQSTRVHMILIPPPCGRPHAINMKYTSLSWNSWYNHLPNLKLKFNYNIIVI